MVVLSLVNESICFNSTPLLLMNFQTFSSRLLVFIQFTGILLSILPLKTSSAHNILYLWVSAFGILLGLITLSYNKIDNFRIIPELKPKSQLILTGPYHLIRHPMYSSLVIIVFGTSLYRNHLINFIGLTLLIVAVYAKAKKEEFLLENFYPAYKDYRKRTAMFIPFLW